MSFRFLLSADLGQSPDPSAIAILEEKLIILERGNLGRLNEQLAAKADIKVASVYHCRYLERIPLGTPYPQVLDRCQAWLNKPELRGETVFLLDYTGVGHPVYDFARDRGMSPVGIVIHGGREVTATPAGYNVPKRDLVSMLLAMMQSGRLLIAETLQFTQALRTELLNFKMRITPTGKTSYEAWREGEHDDLVLALAMGCWYAHKTGGAEQRIVRMTRRKDWDPLSMDPEDQDPPFNPMQFG